MRENEKIRKKKREKIRKRVTKRNEKKKYHGMEEGDILMNS